MRSGKQSGFTYLALLAAMALLALSCSGVMQYVSHQIAREREEMLLSIGQTYVTAIEAYYMASPGNVKELPNTLDDLVDDRRQVAIRRHLREIYVDPLTGKSDWELLRDQSGRVRGLRSTSAQTPIRIGAIELTTNFSDTVIRLQPALHYRDWEFLFDPGLIQQNVGLGK